MTLIVVTVFERVNPSSSISSSIAITSTTSKLDQSIMTSIVQQIKENDPELKEIRLAEDPLAYAPSVAEFCEALEANTEISFVRVDRDFLPCMNDDDIGPFFEALGKLSSLTDAQIWHASVQVSILANFIKAAQHLEHLQLGCLELEGEHTDFGLINAAIEGHPTLKSFTMSDL
jgi:hypothetical protein